MPTTARLARYEFGGDHDAHDSIAGHTTIDSIMPQHFLQTAARCGVPASLVQGILDEIENDTDRAIEAAVSGLPSGFPERIVSSVIEGVRRRLRLFAHAMASA
jgi:hypothetical protein